MCDSNNITATLTETTCGACGATFALHAEATGIGLCGVCAFEAGMRDEDLAERGPIGDDGIAVEEVGSDRWLLLGDKEVTFSFGDDRSNGGAECDWESWECSLAEAVAFARGDA